MIKKTFETQFKWFRPSKILILLSTLVINFFGNSIKDLKNYQHSPFSPNLLQPNLKIWTILKKFQMITLNKISKTNGKFKMNTFLNRPSSYLPSIVKSEINIQK
jgi:hypothetical protein